MTITACVLSVVSDGWTFRVFCTERGTDEHDWLFVVVLGLYWYDMLFSSATVEGLSLIHI